MKIGELEQQTGVPAKTIRYYEASALPHAAAGAGREASRHSEPDLPQALHPVTGLTA